jgi:hypothetical protein
MPTLSLISIKTFVSFTAGKFGVVLNLHQRVDIAIGIAHALTYLHLYAGNIGFLIIFP